MSWDVLDTTTHLHVCTKQRGLAFSSQRCSSTKRSPVTNHRNHNPSISNARVPTAAYYLLLFSTNLAIYRPAQSSLWHLFAYRNYTLLFFSRVLTEDSADHPHTQLFHCALKNCAYLRIGERGTPYAYYFIFILFQLPHRYSESPDYIIIFISSWFGMDAMRV